MSGYYSSSLLTDFGHGFLWGLAAGMSLVGICWGLW